MKTDYISVEKQVNNDEIKPIRVLHVFAALVRGGAESRTMDLYRKIDKSKVQFDFLESKKGVHDFTNEAISMGSKLYYVPHPREIGFVKYVRSLVRLFKENNIQIVHCHLSVASGTVMLAAKIAGVPKRIVHSRSASKPPISKKKLGQMFGMIYDFIMRKLILSCATNLVTCGTDAGDFLYGKKAMKNRDVTFLPNAIDIKRFETTPSSKIEARKNLNIASNTEVIGTVGNMRAVKNHQFLVCVFEEYHKRIPDSKLIIVGDGEMMETIKAMVAEKNLENNVMLLGARNDVEKILPAFDVFVMTSIYEGVPGAAIEAIASGLPCVLSDSITKDINFSPEFVRYVSLESDMDVWCNAIHDYAVKDCNVTQMRQKLIEYGYTVDKSVETLYSLYGV